jgi:hypothetical protein
MVAGCTATPATTFVSGAAHASREAVAALPAPQQAFLSDVESRIAAAPTFTDATLQAMLTGLLPATGTTTTTNADGSRLVTATTPTGQIQMTIDAAGRVIWAVVASSGRNECLPNNGQGQTNEKNQGNDKDRQDRGYGDDRKGSDRGSGDDKCGGAPLTTWQQTVTWIPIGNTGDYRQTGTLISITTDNRTTADTWTMTVHPNGGAGINAQRQLPDGTAYSAIAERYVDGRISFGPWNM